MRFKLIADDITVWSGNTFPTQRQINLAANAANLRGWNGTTLDVTDNDVWVEFVKPDWDAYLTEPTAEERRQW